MCKMRSSQVNTHCFILPNRISLSLCVRACVVTAMETGMRASEMAKAIFSVWQPQAHLDREEGR